MEEQQLTIFDLSPVYHPDLIDRADTIKQRLQAVKALFDGKPTRLSERPLLLINELIEKIDATMTTGEGLNDLPTQEIMDQAIQQFIAQAERMNSQDDGTELKHALKRVHHEELLRMESEQPKAVIVPFEQYIESREHTILHSEDLPFYLLMPEVQQLLDVTLNDRHRYLYDFIWHTGARISEALQVRPKDLVLDSQINSYVSLICLKRGNRAKKAKNNEIRREVPITDIGFIQALKRYIKTHNIKRLSPLFELSRKTAYAAIQRSVKAAGLPQSVTPHTLRHSYAVNHLLYGQQIENVKKWLGHKDIRSTEIYLQVRGRNITDLAMKTRYRSTENI